MNGILLINKPQGMTSHDVVAAVRRKLGMKRIGHAGTLDPLATGLLIILVGPATKQFDRFVAFDKGYEAVLRLGITTDTADINGKVLQEAPWEGITPQRVRDVFKTYVGEIDQVPPMYSAVKVGGKRLYKLARKGIEVKRTPRKITIHQLEVRDIALPDITFSLECSKGTYVRQLAEDIGNEFGCGGCIVKINRTRIGPFRIEEAIGLDEIDERHLRQLARHNTFS